MRMARGLSPHIFFTLYSPMLCCHAGGRACLYKVYTTVVYNSRPSILSLPIMWMGAQEIFAMQKSLSTLNSLYIAIGYHGYGAFRVT
jgi:hypothetical protein